MTLGSANGWATIVLEPTPVGTSSMTLAFYGLLGLTGAAAAAILLKWDPFLRLHGAGARLVRGETLFKPP